MGIHRVNNRDTLQKTEDAPVFDVPESNSKVLAQGLAAFRIEPVRLNGKRNVAAMIHRHATERIQPVGVNGTTYRHVIPTE